MRLLTVETLASSYTSSKSSELKHIGWSNSCGLVLMEELSHKSTKSLTAATRVSGLRSKRDSS